MKGLTFLMWNFIMIYPLVSKIYRENVRISAIIDRLPVEVELSSESLQEPILCSWIKSSFSSLLLGVLTRFLKARIFCL